MGKFFDFNDPFYRPLWLRILIVGFCLGWALFEFVGGSPFWGVIFAGAGAMAFHGLFITFNPRDPKDPQDNKGAGQ
ncbi:MAG TPA: DUF3329 domain-containing protein [Rhizobiaceae bacterium]|nr:DUF3329 domain-containing protein [Rhizobiaceae bacterium]